MESYNRVPQAEGLQMNYQEDFTSQPTTIDYNHSSDPSMMNFSQPQQETDPSMINFSLPQQESTNTASASVNKTNLIVNYLPQTMTDREFEGLFRTIAPIKSCKICRDRKTNYSYGYGFVEYFTPEAAQQAIDVLNGLPVQHKFLKVALSREGNNVKGANLFVTNLPKTVTEKDLVDVFGVYGTIIQPKILKEPGTGLSKGAGFVLFDKKPEAETALAALNGSEFPGHLEKMNIKFAEDNTAKVRRPANPMPPSGQRFNSPGPVRSPTNRFANRFNPLHSPSVPSQRMNMVRAGLGGNTPTDQSGHILFVYNIGPQASEQDIFYLFQPFGSILKIDIIWDKAKNQGKGYCFVTMANRAEAEKAQAILNGYSFINKPLQVSFKKPKMS